MKTITEKINESITTKQSDIIVDLLFQMFTDSKLSSDDVYGLFKNVDIEIIRKIEKKIYERDAQHFIAYMAQDDDYLDDANHDHVIRMFVEYIQKHVAN